MFKTEHRAGDRDRDVKTNTAQTPGGGRAAATDSEDLSHVTVQAPVVNTSGFFRGFVIEALRINRRGEEEERRGGFLFSVCISATPQFSGAATLSQASWFLMNSGLLSP